MESVRIKPLIPAVFDISLQSFFYDDMVQESFYRISGTEDVWYKPFYEIYAVSFPVYEQRNRNQQLTAFSDGHYNLLVQKEEELLSSFISYWEFDDYIYIEHLAVNPELRGQNIGSQTLTAFAETTDKTIILEIDPLRDEIARKRLRFYQNLGYQLNRYTHYHPPYNPEYPPHELLVLSFPEKLSEEQYNRFAHDLNDIIMR